MKRKVKIHPLPKGAPRPLTEFTASVVGGAIRDFLNAHGDQLNLGPSDRGMLLGSIRKRIINKLLDEEGREIFLKHLSENEEK